MIKAIIFDFGDVLAVPGITLKVLKEYKDFLNSSPKQALDKIIYTDHIEDLMRDKISLNQFHKILANLQGTTLKMQEDIGNRISELTQINQDVLDIAKKLSKNYKLAILSDHIKGIFEKHVNRFRLTKYFDEIVFSAHHGFLKEDETLFDILLEKMKLKPEECLFIDDRQINIKIAEKLGFNTVHFDNSKQLEKELKQRGVL
ncbi:MAG: Glyceraldehyde 3-phosphate phosphatase [Candidatus Woesearchaeota archaeon]|nr:Glyceraldehyde 3-phosphate phosphatase [Candidatus Woesearchaeota archaeon]